MPGFRILAKVKTEKCSIIAGRPLDERLGVADGISCIHGRREGGKAARSAVTSGKWESGPGSGVGPRGCCSIGSDRMASVLRAAAAA